MPRRYIRFKLIDQKIKTNVYQVFNTIHGTPLGIIKWYPAWRKYCFYPYDETWYETECLQELITFINRIKIEQKAGKHGKQIIRLPF